MSTLYISICIRYVTGKAKHNEESPLIQIVIALGNLGYVCGLVDSRRLR